MGRYSKIAVAAIAILTIAGCSSDGEQAATPTPAPTATGASVPAAPVQAFNNPVVPGKPQVTSVATVVTPNLIQPTNSTERAVAVMKGRPDPFAQIVSPSAPIVPITAVAPIPRRVVPELPALPRVSVVSNRNFIPRRVVPELPALPRVSVVSNRNFRPRSVVISATTQRRPSTRVANALPRLPRPMARGRGFVPVLPRVMPQVVPNPSLVSVLPPTPQPELARAVAVTGVVLVGREPQAIIKVPTEPSSRYVNAGDRLSNGLLVKRIEMNEGSEPIVIFEQFGIEVARMVGEGAAAPATTASADSVPPPPSSVPTGAS